MHPTRIQMQDLLALSHPARQFDLGRLGRRQLRSTSGQTPRLRGRGMTFEEHRAYQPGDEPRFIDWRVTARTGEMHVKIYREEHERPVHILVDVRPSMAFGSRRQFKRCLAAEATALLAWAATHSKERVGGIVLGQTIRECAARSANHGVLNWLQLVCKEDAAPAAPPRLAQGCEHLRRVARPGAIVVLCSDFADHDQQVTTHLAELSRHCQLILLPISDPLESQPPASGQLALRSQQHNHWFDFGQAQVRQRWQEHFQQRRAAVETLARQCRSVLLPLSTAQSAEAQLAPQLLRR